MRPQAHADALQANTQRQTRTLHCVMLRTLVSRYVSNCRRCGWIPILCRRLWMRTVFLTVAKMFASAHLSSAAAGINHDGRRRCRVRAAQLNLNEQLMKS